MNGNGLEDGDDYAVIVYRNGVSICAVTGDVVSNVETAASLYTDGDSALVTAAEILQVAVNAAKFYMQKPRLQQLLRERIEQLKREDEEAGENYPPAPTISDMPF
jgi:hypothetical protein